MVCTYICFSLGVSVSRADQGHLLQFRFRWCFAFLMNLLSKLALLLISGYLRFFVSEDVHG